MVSLVLSRWPDAIKEKDSHGWTPLHYVCNQRASVDVISLLLSSWPDMIKQKDHRGCTPLHTACLFQASPNVISLLLKSWPGATKEKNNLGHTPLHCACNNWTSVGVVSLLLSSWPAAIKEKDKYGKAPWHCGSKYTSRTLIMHMRGKGDGKTLKILLFCVSSLYSDEKANDNPSLNDIMRFFINIEWWNGVLLLVDKHPSITKTLNLHTNIMPHFLSVVGKCCNLTTMWEIIENEQELLANVQ